jgi:protein-tyrosine phosphatase
MQDRQPQPSWADRRVLLEGAINVRDLGGLVTPEGRCLHRNRVFRADALHRLSAQDDAILERLDVRRIFDLRSAAELAQDRLGAFAEADDRHRHRPLVGVTLSPFDPSIDWATVRGNSRYVHMLHEGGAVIVEILEWLAVPDQAPTLFHCAAGKDRTGVVAAVLLATLGVDHETIVEDYAASGPCLEPVLSSRRQQMLDGGLAREAVDYLTTAPARRMAETLKSLVEEWGGVDGYLRSVKARADLRERLALSLLEEL